MENFLLWENGAPDFDENINQPQPNITFYPAAGSENDTEPRGCVIVCPGGGYGCLAPHEAAPIAEKLNMYGYHAFVLTYRLAPYRHPVELGDALRAIRFVRYYADKFHVKKNKIAILGFSAGGHLTVSASEHFDYGRDDGDEIDRESSRPDGAVYCYAVSKTEKPYTHEGTVLNLLGRNPDEKLVHLMDGEASVREDMPPVFIWHTMEDEAVPVENALIMAKALKDKNVPVEVHLYPYGQHGIGNAASFPLANSWMPLLGEWLKYYGF